MQTDARVYAGQGTIDAWELLDGVPVPMALLSRRDFQVCHANEQMLQYAADPKVFAHLRSLADRFVNASSSKSHSVQTRFPGKPGEWVVGLRKMSGANGQEFVLVSVTSVQKNATDRSNSKYTAALLPDQLIDMADSMPQLVWMADISGRTFYYNTRAAEFDGFTVSEDGTWNWQAIPHPDDLQRTAAAWQEAVMTGQTYEIQHRLRLKSGEYKWYLSRAMPSHDADGKILIWYGTATDIDLVKTAEAKLRESELRFRSLAENSPDCISRHAPDGRFLYASPAVENLFSITPVHLIGKSWRDAGCDQDTAAFFEQQIEICVHKRSAQSAEFHSVGLARHLLVRTVPELNQAGAVESVLALTTDITKRKREEARLLYLAALVENIADAVIGTDEEHRIIWWNRVAEEIYGWKQEEVLGKYARDVLHNEFNQDDQNQWKESFDKTGYWRGLVTQRTKNGERIQVLVSVSSVRDESGKVIGGVGINRDISEHKRAEQELVAIKEQFEQTFANIPAGVLLIDEDNRVRFINQEARRIFGAREEEPFKFTDGNLFSCMAPAHDLYTDYHVPLKDADNPVSIVRSSGKPISMMIKRVSRDDARAEWYLTNCSPITDPARRVEMVLVVMTDLTIQKLADEKIRTSEEQLRIALEVGELGFFDFYPQTGKLYWSPRTRELFGVDADCEPGLKVFEQAIHPEDYQLVYDANVASLTDPQKHGRYDVEYRVVGINDHRIRWVRAKGRVFFDDLGKPVRFMGVMQETTRQRETELALRSTKTQLEATFNNFFSGIYLFDGDGNILMANNAVASLFEYESSEALMAEKHILRIHEHTNVRFQILNERGEFIETSELPSRIALRERKPAELVFRLYSEKKHTSRWLWAKASPLFDQQGALSMVLTSLTDITQQKIAEDKIRENEKRWQLLANTIPSFVWSADPTGELNFLNENWYRFTGLTREESLGTKWTNAIHPDDLEHCLLRWRQSLEYGLPYEIETRYRRYDGVYRWGLSRALPLRNDAGEITGWYGTSTDIHDQKNLSDRLENLVSERTRALEQSNEDLQQFAHVASHDLKEPIRKIKTFLNLLELETAGTLSPRAQQFLNKIGTSANRMHEMVDGVLRYSSLGNVSEGNEVISLTSVVENISSDLELIIAQKDARILVTREVMLHGSYLLVYQLFYNLVNNALKFTRQGVKPEVTIDARRTADREMVEVIVRDNGIGFNQRFSQDIFKTFTRLNSKDKFEGSGLGLALCKKIAERHGGSISATGEEGKGATFYVHLPGSF